MPARKKSSPRPPLTAQRLEELALRYVSRYAASARMLERVLQRHILRAQHERPGQEDATLHAAVAAILKRYAAKGWVNDEALAQGLLTGGRKAGLSRGKLVQKMQAKGIGRDLIRQLLAESGSAAEDEWDAIRIFARRKKIGPYATRPDADPKKEMGRLCRAGFPPALARRLLRLEPEDDGMD